MSAEERINMQQKLQDGLEMVQYRILRDKALKNQDVVRCNEKGMYEQPAREAFAEVYHEDLGDTKVKEFANQ